MKREVALRQPMTAEEIQLVRALADCRLRAGSGDERFCSDLAAITRRQGRVRLTEGQKAYLWRIASRYRATLPPEISEIVTARQSESSDQPPATA
ncbi:MAG TPA: hypothetical protein VL418_08515 [Devosiaceae bacterium]|jgi:hypothetical protein|nr:hypothetical protein [Devosiaceae bacterium]